MSFLTRWLSGGKSRKQAAGDRVPPEKDSGSTAPDKPHARREHRDLAAEAAALLDEIMDPAQPAKDRNLRLLRLEDRDLLAGLFCASTDIMVKARVLQTIGLAADQDLDLVLALQAEARTTPPETLTIDPDFAAEAVQCCSDESLCWALDLYPGNALAQTILRHTNFLTQEVPRAASEKLNNLDAYHAAMLDRPNLGDALSAIEILLPRPDLVEELLERGERAVSETGDTYLHVMFVEALRAVEPDRRARRGPLLARWLTDLEARFAEAEENKYANLFFDTLNAIDDPALLMEALERTTQSFAVEGILKRLPPDAEALGAFLASTSNTMAAKAVQQRLSMMEATRELEQGAARLSELIARERRETPIEFPDPPIVPVIDRPFMHRVRLSEEDEEWVQGLRDPNGAEIDTLRLRKLARETLADLRLEPEAFRETTAAMAPQSATTLLHALEADVPRVRANAASALGRRRESEAIDPLRRATGDREPDVRRAAFDALAGFGDDIARPAMVKALGDSDQATRSRAVSFVCDRLLAGVSFPDAQSLIDPLRDALADWDAGRDALMALRHLGWLPEGTADRVHVLCAERDGAALRDDWAASERTLLVDVRSNDFRRIEHAVLMFIGLGEHEVVPRLVEMIERHGAKPMADAYLNCGLDTLRDAAVDWAQRNGYEIKSGLPSRSIHWGGL